MFLFLTFSLPAHQELHFPQCFTPYFPPYEKDNPQSVTLFCFFWEKTNAVQSNLVISECFCIVRMCWYQYCRLVHQNVWSIGPLFDEVTRVMFSFLVFFFGFFVVIVLEEWTLFFWTFVTNSQSALCVHGHEQNVSAEKKASKRSKKLKKKKKNKRSGCVCSDLVLFIKTKKYWHWTKWTKNKKSIFYSVYMEIKIPVCCIALLYKSNVLVAFF